MLGKRNYDWETIEGNNESTLNEAENNNGIANGRRYYWITDLYPSGSANQRGVYAWQAPVLNTTWYTASNNGRQFRTSVMNNNINNSVLTAKINVYYFNDNQLSAASAIIDQLLRDFNLNAEITNMPIKFLPIGRNRNSIHIQVESFIW